MLSLLGMISKLLKMLFCMIFGAVRTGSCCGASLCQIHVHGEGVTALSLTHNSHIDVVSLSQLC